MQELIVSTLNAYAHNPWLVYSIIFLAMYSSSFGLPIPEELTLITVGIVSYINLNPHLYPVPEGGTTLNLHVTAFVCFAAVLSSDYLVFLLGKHFGRRVLKAPLINRIFSPDRVTKIENWTAKYGQWACGVFRFTPGLRFPGHLSCGMMGLPSRTFLAVDGLCALLTVPTQVYAVAFFGEEIVSVFKNFKIGIALVLAAFLIFYLGRKFSLRRRRVEKQVPHNLVEIHPIVKSEGTATNDPMDLPKAS